MKQKYISLLILLLASINNVYAQDNTKVSKQPESTQPESAQNMKEDPNARYRTDTVSFAVTTSLLGAGYIKGHTGLLSSISLEMYIVNKNKHYLWLGYQFGIPIIKPCPDNIFSDYFFNVIIGYGQWAYKNLDSNKKGWIVGYNLGVISGTYSAHAAKQKHSSLNGWIFGLGLTTNMRAIYQLNRDLGFIIGADISYYFPFSFTTGLDVVHGFTGGITTGLAF